MAKSVTENYAAIVAVRNPKQPIDTTSFFDLSIREVDESPIDQFLTNCLRLNEHWVKLNPSEEIPLELGNLLLLGYVSAVEGFMRSLLRRLINIDRFTQKVCESCQVTYAAVLHHQSDQLPDALLEETVFSGGSAISSALSKFIGFSELTGNTKKLLEEYDQICQLRHCCVHRFGKLGVKNATSLGLSTHGQYLEKQILIRKKELTDIADLLFALVKSVNNEVFGFVLKRTATGRLGKGPDIGIGWTWNKLRDKKRFLNYYKIFASTKDATPSASAADIYEMFRNTHNQVGRKIVINVAKK